MNIDKEKKQAVHLTPSSAEEKKIIRRLSITGIAGNTALSVFKLIAGIFGHSGAMLSDSVHSFSDVFATLVAFLGVKLSKKPSDHEHPYGHERFECVASLTLGIILLLTGLGIGAAGIETIISGDYKSLETPGAIALVAAIVSIAVKESMFWYTRYYAKKINSPAFMADAWHHRSDALSSVGSLIGIGGAMLGFPVMDSIASVVICLFILKVSYDILKDALSKMLDTSCDDSYEARLRRFVEEQPEVLRVDMLHTRMFGNKIYMDLEIEMDGDKTLRESHAVAERVHDKLESSFPDIKHVMIHVNPAGEEQREDTTSALS